MKLIVSGAIMDMTQALSFLSNFFQTCQSCELRLLLDKLVILISSEPRVGEKKSPPVQCVPKVKLGIQTQAVFLF